MNCEKIEELLSPYLEDELSPEEKKEVEKHLRTCKGCSELISFMTEAKVSLADIPQLDVSENLLDRLYAIPGKRKRLKLSFDFFTGCSLYDNPCMR